MQQKDKKHITLIGAGIMSATLGILLNELNPEFEIELFERMDQVAAESSDAWNNAGTGHSAFCELNYTPEIDGQIDISKAVKIATQFEMSKSFWAYLVSKRFIENPESFINNIPHISFVWGEENVDFLRRRAHLMHAHPLFSEMRFSNHHDVLLEWMPLVMQSRKPDEVLAATKMDIGTDVNFGNLTRVLFNYLESLPNVTLHLNHELRDLEKLENGQWRLKVKDELNDLKKYIDTDFVFLGAGGGSLPLLDKSDIEEAKGYGGFPVSGEWLVCNNPEVIEQHAAKVYGKASVGAPPMSVPHLDTRMIDGKKELLFGPFAGFSTKFLKHGSYFDLPMSIEFDNVIPMLQAGWDNIELTKYLILQVSMSHEEKVEALKEYYPEAKLEDWDIKIAGQRVQVIKDDPEKGGVLEFGTELVCSADGSLAALLGASPGASTSVKAMLDVLKKCFTNEMNTDAWKQQLATMIPIYSNSTDYNKFIFQRRLNNNLLHLDDELKS
jgi:malate dehydrogenase (quinone)